jgi:hypothetical protein
LKNIPRRTAAHQLFSSGQLHKALMGHLRTVQKLLRRVRSYFRKTETTRSAASNGSRSKTSEFIGTTLKAMPEQFGRERLHFWALPPRAFDTSWRIYRKVNKDWSSLVWRS